jgi:hypothetical protein
MALAELGVQRVLPQPLDEALEGKNVRRLPYAQVAAGKAAV